MRYLLLILLLAGLITGGCVSGPQKAVIITTQPTPVASAPATMPTPQNQDPIIGTWDNGMVFYANGTFGDDGMTTWRPNRDEKNSYFIIHDEPSPSDQGRNISSTEWQYVPGSDSIHKRGSSATVHRRKE